MDDLESWILHVNCVESKGLDALLLQDDNPASHCMISDPVVDFIVTGKFDSAERKVSWYYMSNRVIVANNLGKSRAREHVSKDRHRSAQ